MAGILDSLASYVQNMLAEMVTEEVHMLLGVPGQIDQMGTKLRDLKNFLADADRRNITDKTVQEWVGDMRNAMYDATDILDLCQLKAKDKDQSRDMGCFNPLLFCMRDPLHAHDIGNRINQLNRRLDDIDRRRTDLGFTILAPYEDRRKNVASSNLGSRETSGVLDESSLVGDKIEEDTRNMVDMLTKEKKTHNEYNKLMVFAIVGVGGIGKTTLAQKIYNNDIMQQGFTKKIWLSVNQDFNENELLKRVIVEAGGDHRTAGNAKATLQQVLKETLKGHKTFVVMDDVWDHRAWEDVLKAPLFNVVAQGSRVLVTTRHENVARGMKAEKPYHRIDKLELQDAWSLIKNQVVENENDESHVNVLKDIGMQIIEKCDGLPLALKVTAGLLRQKNMTRRDWENVLNDSMWSVSQMPEDLNYTLYLSYQDLPPQLKPCFLHFSLLPKSQLFSHDEVVGMWISEGFVHGDSKKLEELGREYYNELISRNLIAPERRYTEQRVCSMHDVVRSFGQYMARDEALVAHNNETGIIRELNSRKFIRVSLEIKGSESNVLEWNSIQTQISPRTLILVGHVTIKHGDSLDAFTSLRTLYVRYAKIDALMDSLYQLKHLRYLSIENSDTSRLPENIGKMKFLQYINLVGCNRLAKLPCSIVRLQQLRFLGINDTSISNIPRGFGGLTNLRKLYGFPSYMDGGWCSLEELGPLSHLAYLAIYDLENISSSSFALKARISEKMCLRCLYLSCSDRDDVQFVKEVKGIPEKEQQQIENVFDDLCPPPSLENIAIKGYFGRRLPRWMMSTAVEPLGRLRILTMQDLLCCTELPNGLCRLPFLELLQIKNAPVIKRVGPDFMQLYDHRKILPHIDVAFPRLGLLQFIEMVEWEEWEWDGQVKAMPILEQIFLSRCKLGCIPPSLSSHARESRNLGALNVQQLSSSEIFASVVRLDVFKSSNMERISNLPKLEKLVIVECPKLKVLEGMPMLQRLNLEDYDMETLPGYLRNVNPRHLLLDCTLSLLTSIAAGKSGPEWDKFSHIQQVRAYAYDEGVPRKRYVLYMRDPFSFETNISRSAIAQARSKRTWLPYNKTCPVEEELSMVERLAHRGKRQPLCLRFRWSASVHLIAWLRRVCLHCKEAVGHASPSDQWTEEAGIVTGTFCWTTDPRRLAGKETS